MDGALRFAWSRHRKGRWDARDWLALSLSPRPASGRLLAAIENINCAQCRARNPAAQASAPSSCPLALLPSAGTGTAVAKRQTDAASSPALADNGEESRSVSHDAVHRRAAACACEALRCFGRASGQSACHDQLLGCMGTKRSKSEGTEAERAPAGYGGRAAQHNATLATNASAAGGGQTLHVCENNISTKWARADWAAVPRCVVQHE
ncbi:hypothetical protein SVAN01_05048 [Stagonosporopsis vannaccii]|nr:hypothetical protein SVAN01_05048 [Stagonosporopsis vannaccii]